MKPVLFCGLLLLANLLAAQVYYSNNVPRALAIKAAASLKNGMWEESAVQHLRRSGLTNYLSVGCKTSWYRYYGLADGSDLVVYYYAREALPGYWGGNGLVQRAFIREGTNEISITITNRP
jgi:hypothetical protein